MRKQQFQQSLQTLNENYQKQIFMSMIIIRPIRTYELAVQGGAIVKKEPRQGKGNVIRQMFFDIDADYYLMVDGDDTYPAEAVHGLFEKLRSGEADMVIGDRLSNGTYFDENKRPFHDFGNNLVRNTITRMYKNKNS